MEIRSYTAADAPAILRLFRETILTVNLGDYTQEQCEVWANSFTSIEVLDKRLKKSVTYIVELDGRIVGFGNVNDLIEIDLLYVHKDFQRNGIASVILKKLETYAKSIGFGELTTEVSITARKFFEAKGYRVEENQIKFVRGCEFVNFRMKKGL